MLFGAAARAGEGDHELRFATDAGVKFDALQTRLDGKAGFHSKAATRRLLERLDEIDPDVVHLHNLHGYYVNIEMLFEWLAARDCRVEWTLPRLLGVHGPLCVLHVCEVRQMEGWLR